METTPPKENRKRGREINSDSSVNSEDSLPSRKQSRTGEDNYKIAATCAEINDVFNSLINGQGQDNITDEPSVAAERARMELTTLGDAINTLINTRQERQLQMQQQAEAVATAEMSAIEAAQIVDENIQFINEVVNTMTRSQERLGRVERVELNRRIIQLINDSITNSEIRQQLEEEPAEENLKNLFDALIRYTTAMASYSYENSPEIIAKLGSILAGSTIIAGTICGIGSMNNTGGSLLIYLSQLIQTGTATGAGLYFLGRGGLNVENMLGQVGITVRECVGDACIRVRNKGQDFMNALKESFNEWRDAETISSVSADSMASTADSAVTAISEILSIPENDKILLLENGDFDNSLVGSEIGFNVSPPSSQVTDATYYGSQGYEMDKIDGGRKRKSRRHMKIGITRKGRKGRKGRMTKRGRKHHRTMKRYRSKGRR